MSSPCRVSLIATLNDRSVLVEDAGNPDILLRGLEGVPREFGALINRAWQEIICTRDVSDINLHLGTKLPYGQRNEILKCQNWLLQRVLGIIPRRRRYHRPVEPPPVRIPPSPELSRLIDMWNRVSQTKIAL